MMEHRKGEASEGECGRGRGGGGGVLNGGLLYNRVTHTVTSFYMVSLFGRSPGISSFKFKVLSSRPVKFEKLPSMTSPSS